MRLFRDTWLLFARELRATLRSPVFVIVGLFSPLCYLLLFAPLLDGLAAGPGFPPGGALAVFTPGLLVMLGIYGTLFAGFGLIEQLRAGTVERLRVTPVSRLALPLGAALRDVVVLLVQATLLLLVAWLRGLRADPAGVTLALGLVLLLGLGLASCSYALALALRDENALASTLQFVSLPLLLLSGILLPLTLAPRWLRALAVANPFTHAVDAVRALFAGDLTAAAVPRGFAAVALLTLLALWWAVGAFRQAIA
jgi:ABC-2 type transport system permease protein